MALDAGAAEAIESLNRLFQEIVRRGIGCRLELTVILRSAMEALSGPRDVEIS